MIQEHCDYNHHHPSQQHHNVIYYVNCDLPSVVIKLSPLLIHHLRHGLCYVFEFHTGQDWYINLGDELFGSKKIFFVTLTLTIISLRRKLSLAARFHKIRDDICHKHHKQRLCKIIITQVKVHFVDVWMWYDSVFGNIKQYLPIKHV